ncbi:TPA: hypothetical protein ACSP2L_002491 [Aeromonas veronii]
MFKKPVAVESGAGHPAHCDDSRSINASEELAKRDNSSHCNAQLNTP